MKLKIRKVEVDSFGFFTALESILITHERIPGNVYVGCPLELVCKNLGIKTLEFWNLKFEYENEFEERFNIIQTGYDVNFFYVWRKVTYDKQRSSNLQ